MAAGEPSTSSLSLSSTASSLASERKPSTVPQTRNPISVRLYKVLSNNFDDDATKEALQILSDLYIPPQIPKRSEQRILLPQEDTDHDAHELKTDCAAVITIDEVVPGESAAHARRHMRRDLENKLTKSSEQFLKAFGDVDQKVDELQQHINAMRLSCDEAEHQLQLTADLSKNLLERAGSLRDERFVDSGHSLLCHRIFLRQDVENKKSIVTAFLARFTLTEQETEAISSRNEPVGPIFFAAMDRTESIRDDCQILMSGEDGPTQVGIDIMASTSSSLERGYEKILRWCSHEFRQRGRELHFEVTDTMQEAVKRLRKRPELLTEALRFLSQTRQTTLMSSFITALTRGGPSGLPRPIELHAHDPLRYIGDMLAWVHQAVAAERELLETVFQVANDRRMVGSVRVFDGKSEEEDWIRELLDICVEKLCVPLKVRVQQTIRSQESCIVSYKIVNLLQFYMLTMRRTIGNDALLSKALYEIADVAYSVFYEALSAQGRALTRLQVANDDSSLTPPLAILDHVQILREIMSVYQSSLLDEDEIEQVAGFKKILDIMVDPTIEMITKTNEDRSRLMTKRDQPIYVLNCLSYIETALEPFSFTREKQRSIRALIDERVSYLIDEHYANIMVDADIQQVAEICANHLTDTPLSRIPSMRPAELQGTLRNFSLWLSSPDVVQTPRLSQLTVQHLHTKVHQTALERMARAYSLICEEVKKPENKYEAASTLLGSERPFGQIHLLRQILGIDEDGEGA
ncbi:hypothetical protein C0993_007225 [Termitomyces sp. T159_Od127]|nr:hypothetical protein C0993_007225 [Termitomyces sp. T159_Od127]